jgi:ATP-dependent RNA helicase DOB1
LKENLKKYELMMKFEKTINTLRAQIEDCNKMVLEDDLRCMKRVMRRLNLIDKNEIVQLKGRVACDISACDEIIV